jgi:hypothetical protein
LQHTSVLQSAKQTTKTKEYDMKHLNLELEQLEQRIAPGGVPAPSGGGGCGSGGSGSKGSKSSKGCNEGSKDHGSKCGSKDHGSKDHGSKCS